MQAAYEVLKALALGAYVSGQKLASQLNMSRARVWQAVQYLRKTGLEIHAIPGRGYRLAEEVELLESQEIKSLLKTELFFDAFFCEVFHQIHSTNDYLLEATKKRNLTFGQVCLAEEQLQGRGRQGKTWFSPVTKNINMSLYWRFKRDTQNLSSLSLIVGLSVMKAIVKLLGQKQHLGLKWPNDIWYKDKKLAGILIDVKPSSSDPFYYDIVIGVGCNIHHAQLPGFEKNVRISLEEIYQKKVSRNLLIAEILNQLVPDLSLFAKQGFKPFLKDWQTFDILKNKNVILNSASEQTVHGVCLGVNESGALCIDDQNQRKAFISGDVTVRPYAAID